MKHVILASLVVVKIALPRNSASSECKTLHAINTIYVLTYKLKLNFNYKAMLFNYVKATDQIDLMP